MTIVRMAVAALLLLVWAPPCGRAQQASASPPPEDLYRASVVVTGQDPARHDPGLAIVFRRVLAKVAGDPGLLDDVVPIPDIAAIKGAITEKTLRDLLAGRPYHDEQGTRDRPHEMTVIFDAAMVDATLAGLGREPWRGARPVLTLFVHVTQDQRAYTLSRDGQENVSMAEAIASAGDRYGMRVDLPAKATLAGLSWPDPDLAALPADTADSVSIAGTLAWRPDEFGWHAQWRLRHAGGERRWTSQGTNFDEAFRIAAGGAAKILSGN